MRIKSSEHSRDRNTFLPFYVISDYIYVCARPFACLCLSIYINIHIYIYIDTYTCSVRTHT